MMKLGDKISITFFFLCASAPLWLFIFPSCTQKDISVSSLYSVSLFTLDHQNFSLNQLSANKASVILFLQPECPFCNSYGRTLRSLDSTFESKQVKMYGVVAGKFYPDSEIVSY